MSKYRVETDGGVYEIETDDSPPNTRIPWSEASPIKVGAALFQAVTHPIDTVKRNLKGANDFFMKAADENKNGLTKEGIIHVINGTIEALTGLGKPIQSAAEQFDKGDPNWLHNAIVTGLQAGEGSLIAKGAASVVRNSAGVVANPSAVAGRLRNPNSVQAEAADYALQKDIPIGLGEASGNPAIKGAQHLSDRSIGGSIVSPTIKQAQVEALTRTGNEISARVSPAAATPESAGASIATKLQDNIAKLHERANKAYGDLRAIENKPENIHAIELPGSRAEASISRSSVPGVEPEVSAMIDQAVEARIKEISEYLSSDLGSLSGKGKNINTADMNAEAASNLTRSDTGYGKIRIKSKATFPEIADMKQSPGEIARAINRGDGPVYGQLRDSVKQDIIMRYQDEIGAANEAALERAAIRESDGIAANGEPQAINTKNIALPVDMRSVKSYLKPKYDEMLKTMPEAQRQASSGLVAIKNVLESDDFVSASTAEKNLSALKKIGGYNIGKGMRNQSQGLASLAVNDLQRQINKVVTQAGPEAIEALKAGRQATAMKHSAMDIMDALREEPVQAFNQATWANDTGIAYLRKLNMQAPGEMAKVGRAYLDKLLNKATEEGGFAHVNKSWSEWAKLGPETKKILFKDPNLVRELDNFFTVAKMMGENINPSGTGHVVALAGQGGAIVYSPLTQIPLQISAAVLAKMMRNPSVVRKLTQGMKTSASGPSAQATYNSLRPWIVPNSAPAAGEQR